MKILAVFPLALGLATAAAVSTAGSAASSAAAAAASASIIDPSNDVQFKKMSANERAQLVEELQASERVKREVGPAVSPDVIAEAGDENDEEGLEEFVPEEQQEVEAEDGFRELRRRDVEGGEAEQADAGVDEGTAPASDAEAADDAQAEDEKEDGDEDADADEEEELDPTAAENVQNAVNDPEVQAYVSNGDWDDSTDADHELTVSPDAAADADADSTKDVEETLADTDEALGDGTTLSRRNEGTAKTQQKNSNIHLKICPPCMKKKNPPLQCRIMSARRHWCKENKQTCKEKHSWLHRALFVNKPKAATPAKNVSKPKPKPKREGKGVHAQSYAPVKDASPPSYHATPEKKHGKHGKNGTASKKYGKHHAVKHHNSYPQHAGPNNPGKPAAYPVTKHPKHRAGKGKHSKHPQHAGKHPKPPQAPAYGAGAHAGKPKGKPSAYVPIPQGGVPKYQTQPAQPAPHASQAPAYGAAQPGKAGKHGHGKGNHHAGTHAAGKPKHGHEKHATSYGGKPGKPGKQAPSYGTHPKHSKHSRHSKHGKGGKHGAGEGTTKTLHAGAGAYSTAPAAPAAAAYSTASAPPAYSTLPVHGGIPKYATTSTVVMTPTSYIAVASSSAPRYGHVRRGLGAQEGVEDVDQEDGSEEERSSDEEGGDEEGSDDEGSVTESDGEDEVEEDIGEDMADKLARRDMKLGPHVSLRPKCMDTYAPNAPQWCKAIADRRQWCSANGAECRAKHPWLFRALGQQKATGKIFARDTEDVENGEDLDESESEQDEDGMSEEEHRDSDLEMDADAFEV